MPTLNTVCLVQKLTENDVEIEMMEQKQENVETSLFFFSQMY